jgi:transglutaminase-like putative cysteine protease
VAWVKWRVSHRTVYDYDDDVSDSLGIGYLTPRELPWQHVLDHEITIEPKPADFTSDIDHYGNVVTYFQVTAGHRGLDVLAAGTVDVVDRVYDPEMLALPWERCRPGDRLDTHDAWQAVDFALPSPLVAQTEQAWEYAELSLTPGRAIGDAVTELMHRLHADFEYLPGVTTVTSTIDDVFDHQAGVCQDFAHLMLACLRSHGLGVRYASGYVATEPAPGRDRVVGADASHAWGAVWLPDGQWLAVDPTNDRWVNDRYVVAAFGRDYGDVSPLKGVIFTEAKKSTLRVEVDVAPAD